MSYSVLNLASGFFPLVPTDFPGSSITRLINYDPMCVPSVSPSSGSSAQKTDFLQSKIMSGNYKYLAEHGYLPGAEIYFDWQHLLNAIGPLTFDLLISISPYGFSPINTQTDSVIKNGGYAILMGNWSNKYLFKPDCMNGINLNYDRYFYIGAPLWIQGVVEKLTQEYSSHHTGGGGETSIQAIVTYRKR